MVLAAASLALLALAGCGGDPDTTKTAAGKPPDVTVTVPTAESTKPGAAGGSEADQAASTVPPREEVLPVAQKGHPILWVRKGESVVLRSSPDGALVKRLGPKTEFGSPTVFSVDHTQGDWAAVPTPLLPNGRLAWVRLDPEHLGSGFTDLSVTVDLSDRSAQFLQGKKVIDSFPVTIGAPGVETPTGRFAVTDTFRGNLTESAYGCCAVALTARQPHLPSGWLGGNRIAIHGTSGPLGEALSHGCVRAADEDVSLLVGRISLGTPVTISQ